MPRLIINADDFGLTAGVNRAIADSHREGVVTSATLMANSAAFDDAVALAKQNPKLAIGCHVVLVDGAPIAPAAEVKSLCHSSTGEFRESITSVGGAALRGKLAEKDIEREVQAQIAKVRGAGLELSHVDCHKHSHIFPQIARPVMSAAADAGVRAIRNPIEPTWAITASGRITDAKLWMRAVPVHLLSSFEGAFRRAAQRYGIRTTDGTIGITITGLLQQKLFNRLLKRMPEGTFEFVCHPGHCDDALRGVRTRLRESREQELAVLTSDETRQLVKKLGIELITYREL